MYIINMNASLFIHCCLCSKVEDTPQQESSSEGKKEQNLDEVKGKA